MERMSVKELMAKLAKYDEDAMVYIKGGSNSGEEFGELWVEADGEDELLMEVDFF